ncbi:ECF transporter S component [Miniphocaeibacter halophilus]|uniref:ECF transporter S component n=1 Tax=Miniphocaeibacter halophilus TaxID=2931922 RepID=A0AC61MSJ2_9FIRM|nr:ECF transporter S component [Miniphocaeibacter halophilus]QQK07429.1 ECF transporter S component [Miniphocaeibacter halophilus]
MDKSLKNLIYCALLTSLVIVGTIIIRIPIPAVSGYINFGDLFIFLGASLFGPIVGALAGGIGSALADILSGGAQWALFSLIIKGLMGLVVGKLAYKNKFYGYKNLIGTILAIIILVIGYYISGSLIIGSFITGLTSIPYDLLQGIISSVIYFIMGGRILKLKFKKGE